MDINVEIASVKKELVELKERLEITTDKEERVALLGLIGETKKELTAYINLLPKSGKNFLISFPSIYSSILLFPCRVLLLETGAAGGKPCLN
jgi:hypothetical protein